MTCIDFSCNICDARAIAYAVYAEFARLVDFYKENNGTFCTEYCKEAAIIEGVAQSVKIKLESIVEQLEIFTEDTSRFLCELCNGEVDEGQIQRLIAAFKKDCVLYEISTFGEIIDCSVARLRGSAEIGVGSFVAMAYEVFDRLNIVLANYGIEMIKPKPPEIFDAKRHEVLMAEVADGFIRGQVIRVLSCGYRQGNKVLVRANVICAK